MNRLLFLSAAACLIGVDPTLADDQPAGAVTIPVNSPAFVFSPGNWTGDDGLGGAQFRQTWYSGAYFRVAWLTTSANPSARILLDTASDVTKHPDLDYNVDGVWFDRISSAADHIDVQGIKGSGSHLLTVYVKSSEQADRWGSAGVSGKNVVRIKGLQVDNASTAGAEAPAKRWALIVGDSITEGVYANNGDSDNLACWSYFVGQGLQAEGYDYGLSACGYSGWVRPGDGTHDVPAYYMVSGSKDGAGGTYDEANSRWNKIDGKNHSLLDANGHLSAYGGVGQEPALILINFGTNDGLSHVDSSDLQASVTQSLLALRKAAPDAMIDLIVPFGQFAVKELQQGLAAYRSAQPEDNHVSLIDLGPAVANALAAGNYWGGLHPNLRGHAVLASRILALIQPTLPHETLR